MKCQKEWREWKLTIKQIISWSLLFSNHPFRTQMVMQSKWMSSTYKSTTRFTLLFRFWNAIFLLFNLSSDYCTLVPVNSCLVSTLRMFWAQPKHTEENLRFDLRHWNNSTQTKLYPKLYELTFWTSIFISMHQMVLEFKKAFLSATITHR